MRILGSGIAVALLAAIGLAALWQSNSPTEAATGDNLRQFDAQVPACSSGVGTGIAFDGTQIYLSCWSSNVLERVSPADGSSLGPVTISGMSDIRAMAYDSSRGMIWACEGSSNVYLIDLTSLTGTSQFTSQGCIDGLAYDGVDDTIWSSYDAVTNIQHYETDGTLIASFDLTGKLGGYGNSGIAVGGPNLYLANNGGSQIYECDKTLATCNLMSTFPRRIEDLECDPVTFASQGVGAIWSQDAYDRTLNAWEIPAGLCGLGGQPATAELTLDPATATNTVGEDHTVTATLSLSGDPIEGVDIAFEVTDGPNAGDTGSGTTDAKGQAAFTYTGDGGAGTDTIQACTVEPEPTPEPTVTPTPTPEPELELAQAQESVCATATKAWVASTTATATPTPTPTVAAAVLPPTGGTPAGDGGLPWLAIAAGVLAITSGGFVLALRARRAR